MALRNASGKFSLPSFGRKSNVSNTSETSGGPPSRVASNTYSANNTVSVHSGGDNDSIPSPRERDGGGGGHALDGIGRKIGKSIAHTSLLPSLGNQDLRQLQDVISSEKNVMTSAERLAVDMQTAASRLPGYGQQEGPDLQDVLSHSTTLLSQLSVALRTFAQHESAMRSCFKRVREREEQLDEMRRHRRSVGSKAESAERKLAKMGPENKQLPSQTELLESLRNQMRQLDVDIVNEEARNGDFKRQAIKEAMSFKFGGLEELGEKMCIVGELGKLLLEEIPLEETPPGGHRAPYNSYDRTENTVNEAVKCLATVQFHASSAAPKPPAHPRMSESSSAQRNHSLADHEAYEHLPGNPVSPPLSQAPQLPPITDLAYGGVENGQQSHSDQPPRKFSAVSAEILPPQNVSPSLVWNAPSESGDLDIPHYEYEQQRQMDAEREAAEAAPYTANSPPTMPIHVPAPTIPASPPLPAPESPPVTTRDAPSPASSPPQPPITMLPPNPGWQPLKVTQPVAGMSLQDGPSPTISHDRDSYNTHRDSHPPMSLTLSQDGFGTFSESFLNPDDMKPPQRPTSANSGYYTPDEDRASPIIAPPYPTIDVAAASRHMPEEATPTQMTTNLPSTPPLNVPNKRFSRPRPMSGYIPPVAPPQAVSELGETEEFSAPVQMDHDGQHSNYHNSRISSSTFAVPRDVRASGSTFLSSTTSLPDSVSDHESHPRDSYMTYDSRPRDSYATFQSRTSLEDEGDAVVVTIPSEPFRTETPTMHTPTMPAANGLRPSTPTGPPGPGPRMSAAAFRRGARRRSTNFDDTDSSQSHTPSHTSFGHAAGDLPSPRRLPHLSSVGPPSPGGLPQINASTENVLNVQGNPDAPPMYSQETDSLR